MRSLDFQNKQKIVRRLRKKPFFNPIPNQVLSAKQTTYIRCSTTPEIKPFHDYYNPFQQILLPHKLRYQKYSPPAEPVKNCPTFYATRWNSICAWI